MSLFSISSNCCNTSSVPSDGGNSITYDFGLKGIVTNPNYLRNNGGIDSFSNISPQVLPYNAQMTTITTTGDIGLLSAFDIEVYNTGVLVYTLTKPAGINFASTTTSLPSFGQFNSLSVRINSITTQVEDPKVTITFSESV